MVGIVSLVGDGDLGIDALDRVVGEGDVVALARRADQTDRKAEGFGGNRSLVLKPPRDRPGPGHPPLFPCALERHADGNARSCCRASAIPDRLHGRRAATMECAVFPLQWFEKHYSTPRPPFGPSPEERHRRRRCLFTPP